MTFMLKIFCIFGVGVFAFGCQKSATNGGDAKLLVRSMPCSRTLKARFESQEGKFLEAEINADFSSGKEQTYGVHRGTVSDRYPRLQDTLSQLRNHLMQQGEAKSIEGFQPNPDRVKEFLVLLEAYLEESPFRGKTVYLGTPTFRIVNRYLNRSGGNIHVDSINVPRDFFKDAQVFRQNPKESLPPYVAKWLAADRAHGGDPTKSLNGQYFNIWINLANKDDLKSGLIFAHGAELSSLKDPQKFRTFEFMGVTTLKVVFSTYWQKMLWLKPIGLQPNDYLIFPTRTTVHGAIDPLVPDVTGVYRASVEVRFVVFPPSATF